MNTPPIEQLDTLKANHARLDSELQSLHRRGHLTPSEQERARIIKKEKLRTKDRIRVLATQARMTG